MKRNFLSSRAAQSSGFTLVELLVVIGIIAILASVLAVSAGSAINAAKRVKAANTATQIQTAVVNYYTEYSVYPVPANTTTDFLVSTGTDWQPMTVALCGGIDPGKPTNGQVANNSIPNTRQIPYLTLNKGDLDTTLAPAVPLSPFQINGVNSYYQMVIDADYDNIVGDSGTGNNVIPDFAGNTSSTTLTGTKAIAGQVAVWANCDPKTKGTTTNPKFWVHTY